MWTVDEGDVAVAAGLLEDIGVGCVCDDAGVVAEAVCA